MNALPTTAEELYELVCTLQREQQTTQLELRAIQRRSDGLRGQIEEHQSTIAAERLRRQEWVEKLPDLRLSARRQQALAHGACCAARESVKELRAAQAALLRALRNRAVLYRPNVAGALDRKLVCDTPVSDGTAHVSGSQRESAPDARGAQGNREFCDASQATCWDAGSSETIPTAPDTSLYSGVAAHRLLASLRAKLLTCLEAAAVERSPPEASTVATDCTVTELSLEQHQLPLPEAASSSTEPQQPFSERLQQHSSEAAPPAATAARTEPPPPPTVHSHKKHIEFASDALFHRITRVPASNLNRCGPTAPRSTTTSGTTPTQGEKSCTPQFVSPVSSAATATPRGVTKFTVRVASRSSTLLAEAAALGAKRQRTVQALHGGVAVARPRIEGTQECAGDGTPATSPPLSTRQPDASRDDSTMLLRNNNSSNTNTNTTQYTWIGEHASASPTDAAAGSATGPHGSDEVRFDPPAGLSCGGSRLSSGGGAGPRRTVWTWSRASTNGKQQ